jgi:hypothetical protein
MKIIIAILPLLLVSCTVKTETPDSTSTTSLLDTPEGQAVEDMLKRYYGVMSKRNWVEYEKYFWPGGTITTTWVKPGDSIKTVDVTTIKDFIRETPHGPDSKPIFEEKMLNSVITVENNIATAKVEYEVKFGSENDIDEWKGTDLFTLVRHNGEWRIVSLVFEAN